MVTTVSRVLAALLSVLLAFGQSPSGPEQRAVRGTAPSTAVAVVKPWPHVVVKPASDSTTISLALAQGQGKPSAYPRDLPDGYVPPPAALPAPTGLRRLSPRTGGAGLLPEAHLALPRGRAPPLTALSRPPSGG